MVIETAAIEDGENGVHGAGLEIVGAIYEAVDSRLDHGSGAHGTGLDGDVKRRARKPVIADGFGSFAQGNDLGVGARVVIADGAVSGARHDTAFDDDNRAYGNFVASGGGTGLVEGGEHELEVAWLRRGHNMGQDSTAQRWIFVQLGDAVRPDRPATPA